MTPTITSQSIYIVKQQPNKEGKLTHIFHSRVKSVLPPLILQILIMMVLMRTILFFVGLFNLPAMLALAACTLECKLRDYQTQKITKTLLKLGIAKAVGGVLLAAYIGIKCVYLQEGTKGTFKICAMQLAASAFVDIVYSISAFIAIKKTKLIMKALKREKMKAKHLLSYAREPTTTGSFSSPGEVNNNKCVQDNA